MTAAPASAKRGRCWEVGGFSRPPRRLVPRALLVLLAPGILALSPAAGLAAEDPAGEPSPLRLEGQAFSEEIVIEVLDLPREEGEAALRRAFAAVERAAALTDPSGSVPGGAGRINAAAGEGPHPVAPDLLPLLARTLSFCRWSEGAHGPLGGRLYRLWGLRRPAPSLPAEAALQEAVESAACDRLTLDPAAGTAELRAGSRLDLHGYALGYAVDQGTAALRDAGAGNGRVRVGPVERAFGPGLAGRGWIVEPPHLPGLTSPLEPILLKDRALAVAGLGRRLRAGGETYLPFVDQRRGRPAEGVVGVLAVAELATDAQGLAASLFVTGSRRGQMLLGSLRPAPAVLWALGSGEGTPLLTSYHWSLTRSP
jgi:thiamine biosynthesis lipoprotein